jgi:hypothetical protein
MKFRLWSALVPAFLAVALPIALEARPDGADTKSGSRVVVHGAARPVGPTAMTGENATTVSRVTTIIGSAWTAENQPIPEARLQLRNVISGRIEATTVANSAGQFTFQNVEGGSYVVELINTGGKVQLAGHVFSIAPGETVATFVRAGTKVPWFTGFFNNTVSAVSSTAASEGIAAIAPIPRPVSANR